MPRSPCESAPPTRPAIRSTRRSSEPSSYALRDDHGPDATPGRLPHRFFLTAAKIFEARPGGRIVQEYRDVEDADGTDVVVGRAEGVVDVALPHERLAYRLSPQLPDGGVAFTAHVDFGLRATDGGTDLDIHWRITDSTVDSADFIAGIEIGFGQSLDELAALVAADSASTDHTDTRSAK